MFTAGDQVPEILLLDVVGKLKVLPAHCGAIWVNIGAVAAIIFTCIFVEFAHSFALGVKAYKVVAVLFIAGDQVPVMPLFEVIGSTKLVPAHTLAIGVKTGNVRGFLLNVIVVVDAHSVATGSNRNVIVAVFDCWKTQAPKIPFVEVVGNCGITKLDACVKSKLLQIGIETALKVGIVLGVITTVIVGDVAHGIVLGFGTKV